MSQGYAFKPWDFFLAFMDPCAEHDFRARCTQAHATRGKACGRSFLLIAVSFFAAAVAGIASANPLHLQTVWLGSTLAKHAALRWREEFYTRHTFLIDNTSLVLFSALVSRPSFYANLGDLNGFAILIHTPWVPVLVQSIDNAVLFKDWILVQMVSSVISARWLISLDGVCAGGDCVPVQAVQNLGVVVERGFVRYAWFGVNGGEQQELSPAGLLPVLWLHFVVTLVLPAFLLYCFEVYNRSCYLVVVRAADVSEQAVWDSFTGSIFLAVLSASTFAQSAWYLGLGVGKLAQMQKTGIGFCAESVGKQGVC